MIPVVIILPVLVPILGVVQDPGLKKGVMIHNGIWADYNLYTALD